MSDFDAETLRAARIETAFVLRACASKANNWTMFTRSTEGKLSYPDTATMSAVFPSLLPRAIKKHTARRIQRRLLNRQSHVNQQEAG
ncbi:hypothetical protein Q5Y75_24115 [Ruegeria sp. 2205SS24-7]|uniref:hypothetical protein n=1 Tax=Ruegeria discodermiae TaxID=3064389 RepID=UPI0027417E98|nr:hypothetical protein [Ruegeria sp. 2205SS24-7]MDP5220281.1 hypothetical protein [Ruegeria sp. 2205SS24-7]